MVRLDIVLILTQDRCTICAEHTTSLEIILTHPMELLGDEGHVESCFGPFGDSANLEARLVHRLRRTYLRLENCFGRTRWNSMVMWVMWNLTSFSLETVLVLVQDRCTLCAKRTRGLEIILDALDGTTR